MKKKTRKALRIALCPILLLAAICAAGFLYASRAMGDFYSNGGEGGGSYNGYDYREKLFRYDGETLQYLGQSRQGDCEHFNFNIFGGSVYGLKGDPERLYLFANLSLGSAGKVRLVREDAEIPESGTATAVFHDNYADYDPKDVALFGRIADTRGEPVTFTVPAGSEFYHVARDFYFAYNDCPVASKRLGWVGYLEGRWYFMEPEQFTWGKRTGEAYWIDDSELIAFLESDPVNIRPPSYPD